ncbi:MAG: DUF2070 family protein [Archaeoglobaceae archaeon]
MGRDKQVSIDAERLYKRLFKIPEEKKLIPTFLVFLVLFSFLEISTLFFAALVLATTFASIKLVGLKFNLRRTIFLAILILLLGFISFKAFGSFSGAYFLFLAVLYFCSERGFVSSAIASSVPFLILDPFSVPVVVFSALLFFFYLRFLNLGLELNLRDYLRGFVKFWLTEDPSFLEQVLSKDSEVFEGKVKCLRVGSAKLISTDFHPGPFRNVGGAKLVKMLDFPNSVYLHSPSAHERDPVSEEDVLAIRNAVECGTEKINAMRPFEIEGENFKVFCFPFDKIRLIFVSGKRRIDDFVLDSQHFVVDCHNANFYGELSVKEIEEIRELVKKAEKIESETVAVKSGFVKMEFSSDSIVRYLSAILLEYGDEKFAIVVFDSNNVEPKFREKVEEKFARLGYKAIVCSTDNHERTGAKVRESYKPAGSCLEDYEAVERLIEKCDTLELAEVEFFYSEKRVAIRVLGKILQRLEKVEKKADRYIAVFFLLTFVSLLLPLAKVI